MMGLHRGFLDRPIAHRGLHGPGVPENSMAAFRAAVDVVLEESGAREELRREP